MAQIWCCSATVTVENPLDVRGYSGHTFSVKVKVRTESEKEPTDADVIKQVQALMASCYSAGIISIKNPTTNFLLWQN